MPRVRGSGGAQPSDDDNDYAYLALLPSSYRRFLALVATLDMTLVQIQEKVDACYYTTQGVAIDELVRMIKCIFSDSPKRRHLIATIEGKQDLL